MNRLWKWIAGPLLVAGAMFAIPAQEANAGGFSFSIGGGYPTSAYYGGYSGGYGGYSPYSYGYRPYSYGYGYRPYSYGYSGYGRSHYHHHHHCR